MNETREPTPSPSLEKGGEGAARSHKAKKKYRIAEKTKRARRLRNDATPAERRLWTRLSRRQLGGFKFRRQFPHGRYVLDFYCVELKLCVELDSDQHGEDDLRRKDEFRTKYLEENSVEVMRFWNHQVLTAVESAADAILEQAHALAMLRSLPTQNSETE